jgi:hypothetical protein
MLKIKCVFNINVVRVWIPIDPVLLQICIILNTLQNYKCDCTDPGSNTELSVE